MNRLTVIFPVETIVRELDARLILASLYGQQHHRIFVAHASHANRLAAKLRGGGIYVGKHIMAPTANNPESYYRAKDNGFKIIQLSEEGAVFMGNEADWGPDLDYGLNPSLLSKDDYVATWGEFQRGHYLKMGAVNPLNVRAIGHPRFDIYKGELKKIYQQKSNELRSHFGKYILVNSNFSWAVNPLGVKDTFSRWQGYYPGDEIDRLRFVQRWSRHNRVFAEFIELIHRMAIRYRDKNIVIRPHPADDIQQLEAVVAGVPNIHVIRDDVVAPWILASHLMLHNGCTTAIEAYFMRKPIINFSPVKSEQDIFLPNVLGVRVQSQNDALEAIEEATESPRQEQEIPEVAHRIFANFRQDSMASFLELLLEAEADVPRSNAILLPDLFSDQSQFIVLEKAKKVARSLFFEKRYRASQATRALFPGFNRKYIRERLNIIAQITGRPVEMKYYTPWLIELNPVSTRPVQWPL